ncbi:nuclear transport factor 2 family protein [Rhodococcus sp. NCIMB 12038]|uniref:nuclear transport factor 2 family protein n=1 Tax=Rhodococcus sp. NCIMB 12038 TaxID=933800 RepID=UPI0015C5D710|nr:nuclear transport factor 2 family protein [Rhodococcus sp. NCIMB 12038]
MPLTGTVTSHIAVRADSVSQHRATSKEKNMDPVATRMSDSELRAVIGEILDRQAISDVMLRFGRSLDLHDWEMYAAALTDTVDIDFFDLTGLPKVTTTSAAWARFAAACLDRLTVMHQYSNFQIQLDGDQAHGIFYHVSRHRFPNKAGDDHYTQYGWYENSFRRTPDGWRISSLTHKFQWSDGNPTLIDQSDPEFVAAAQAVFDPR